MGRSNSSAGGEVAQDKNIRDRIAQLIWDSRHLTSPPVGLARSLGREEFVRRQNRADGWIASALQVLRCISGHQKSYHLQLAEKAGLCGASGDFANQVQRITALLESAVRDLDKGLIGTVENQAAASFFGDLIDHANVYLTHKQIQVAGVVAGVAFEDSMRRLRAIREIEPDSISMENLISELERRAVFTRNDCRLARAAAALRTSATHARWDEFNKHNVEQCIRFTQQIIDSWLPPK